MLSQEVLAVDRRERVAMSSENPGLPGHDLSGFIGEDLPGLPAFLSPLTAGETYLRGTAIRAIQQGFVQLPNRLIVPESCARPVQPIDQMRTFLTCKEVFGSSFSIDQAYDELRRISIHEVIVSVAAMFRALRQPGVKFTDVDIWFANAFFQDPARIRATNLLRGSNRTLVVPQALLKLLQLSLLHSPPDVPSGESPGNIVAALMIITDNLGRGSVDANMQYVLKDVPGDLGRELIANQIFNAQLYEPHSLGRFVRTWLQLPVEHANDPQVVNLEAAYSRYSGLKLRDVIAVGIALWAGALQNGALIGAGYYRHSALSLDRFNEALSLISAPISTLRGLIEQETSQGAVDWAFDTFNRFPIVRLSNDELVVLDPDMLMRRVFSWTALFDIENGTVSVDESKNEKRKNIERIKACLRHLAEIYASEVLDSIAPSLPAAPRVYHDPRLRQAYSANRIQVADAAIDYGDAWVVVEITTTHMRRDSVKGRSDDAVVADLRKFVDEARQIDSTISCLREKEEDLTGCAPIGPRKFYPLIVATEGFPTSPVTMTLLRDMVREQNILTHADTMPLEVVDITELEMIEGVQAEGGPNLKQVLDSKARASLKLCSMNQYLLAEARLNPKRSPRVNRLFAEGVNAAIRELFPGMPLMPDDSQGA